jgi:hypothetical protein
LFAQGFTYLPAPAVRSFAHWAMFADGSAKRATDGARRVFGRRGVNPPVSPGRT